MVESGPPIAGSNSDGKLNNGKFDMVNHTKTTTTPPSSPSLQTTSYEIEKLLEFGNSDPNINDTNVKQIKQLPNKYENEVTTEKVIIPIAEKNVVANDPNTFEPDASNSNNENPSDDITSNFIDDQPSRNNSTFYFFSSHFWSEKKLK